MRHILWHGIGNGNGTSFRRLCWNITWQCIIEDAMRRDTAAPENWSLAFRDPFWHVLFSGCCLPILWLILLDLGWSCHWQAWVRKASPNMTKNGAKIRSNRPKIGLKSVCVRSQQQSGRWIPKKYGPPLFFSHILGPSGQFEAQLWAHLVPNGGLRGPKWRPDSTKKRCQKSMRKRCRKTMEKEAKLDGVREVKMC